MVDKISKRLRSGNMSRIRSTNTSPEIAVRSFLYKQGFRFRLSGKINKKLFPKGILPGKPDIVLLKYKTVIFIHGCFWHHHPKCKRSFWPKSNREYWIPKIRNNMKRDRHNIKVLNKLGWNIEIIWECEVKNELILEDKINNIKNYLLGE